MRIPGVVMRLLTRPGPGTWVPLHSASGGDRGSSATISATVGIPTRAPPGPGPRGTRVPYGRSYACVCLPRIHDRLQMYMFRCRFFLAAK
eukprot:3629523-Rhodomonas_salina.1